MSPKIGKDELQSKGLYSPRRLVRILRCSRQILHRGWVVHKRNAQFRLLRFLFIVHFIQHLKPSAYTRYYVFAKSMRIRFRKMWGYRRWHLIQSIVNLICRTEDRIKEALGLRLLRYNFSQRVQATKAFWLRWVDRFASVFYILK